MFCVQKLKKYYIELVIKEHPTVLNNIHVSTAQK